MRTIKILDIGYVNVLYVGLSLFFAKVTDYFMGDFDPKKEIKKGKLRLTLEFIAALWIYGVLVYVARNLIELVPFPLDGYDGFEHYRVKEIDSAAAFTFTYVLFSDFIQSKLKFYYRTILK